MPAIGCMPIFDPKLMIDPPFSFMCGKAACMCKSVAIGPEPRARSMSSSVISSKGTPERRAWALLTRMSRPPNAATAAATACSAFSRLLASPGQASTFVPRCSISGTAASSLSASRPVITTAAPSAANARAMPSPTPWLAPVMRATLPSSLPMWSLSVFGPPRHRRPVKHWGNRRANSDPRRHLRARTQCPVSRRPRATALPCPCRTRARLRTGPLH